MRSKTNVAPENIGFYRKLSETIPDQVRKRSEHLLYGLVTYTSECNNHK